MSPDSRPTTGTKFQGGLLFPFHYWVCTWVRRPHTADQFQFFRQNFSQRPHSRSSINRLDQGVRLHSFRSFWSSCQQIWAEGDFHSGTSLLHVLNKRSLFTAITACCNGEPYFYWTMEALCKKTAVIPTTRTHHRLKNRKLIILQRPTHQVIIFLSH